MPNFPKIYVIAFILLIFKSVSAWGGEEGRELSALQQRYSARQVLEGEGPASFSSFQRENSLFSDHLIPPIAQGYEKMYRQFLRGRFIYRPTQGSDEGMIVLSIADLANPLEGTFDLSKCGEAAKYLSIATGYRKEKRPENEKKVEIWIAPWFLINSELEGAAAHFKPIMESWNPATAPVGLFFNWGNWENLNSYDYLTKVPLELLFEGKNLYPSENAFLVKTVIRGKLSEARTHYALMNDVMESTSHFICDLK